MKSRLLRAALGTLLVALTAYATASAYVVMNQGIEDLLLCADNGGLKIPSARALCRGYLYARRGTPQDIADLQHGVGASFVVQAKSSMAEREEVLKFLVTKGLDINRLDMHGLTPLHGAILANSTDELDILLRNGAQPQVKDGKFQLTPLELALKLQSERPDIDRRGTIERLRQAAH